MSEVEFQMSISTYYRIVSTEYSSRMVDLRPWYRRGEIKPCRSAILDLLAEIVGHDFLEGRVQEHRWP